MRGRTIDSGGRLWIALKGFVEEVEELYQRACVRNTAAIDVDIEAWRSERLTAEEGCGLCFTGSQRRPRNSAGELCARVSSSG